MLKNLFHTCGLNDNEQKVLLHLIKQGKSIASVIAIRTKLKRPTVYAILDNLLKYGVIAKQKKAAVNYFIPLSTEIITEVLENRAKSKYHDVISATKILAKELKAITPPTPTEFHGFELISIESVQAVYSQVGQAVTHGNFHGIFDPQKTFINDQIKQIVIDFLKYTSKNQASIQEIIVKGPEAEWYKANINNPNHHIKEIDAAAISSDIIMLENIVYIFNYNANYEAGISIKQKEFYDSMLTIFQALWARL